MSFEATMQEAWRLNVTLVGLVPDNRVYLGWVPSKDADFADLGLPMVSIKRIETGALYPSGDQKLTEGEVTFRCWDETVKGANDIIEAIDDVYGADSCTAMSWIGGHCLVMLQQGLEQDRMDDGTWMVSVTYLSRTTETK